MENTDAKLTRKMNVNVSQNGDLRTPKNTPNRSPGVSNSKDANDNNQKKNSNVDTIKNTKRSNRRSYVNGDSPILKNMPNNKNGPLKKPMKNVA